MQPEPEPFWLWPEHLPVFELWVSLQTQWQHNAANRRTGMRYSDVLAAMTLLDIGNRKQRAARFAELQVMECAALQAGDEMRAQQAGA